MKKSLSLRKFFHSLNEFIASGWGGSRAGVTHPNGTPSLFIGQDIGILDILALLVLDKFAGKCLRSNSTERRHNFRSYNSDVFPWQNILKRSTWSFKYMWEANNSVSPQFKPPKAHTPMRHRKEKVTQVQQLPKYPDTLQLSKGKRTSLKTAHLHHSNWKPSCFKNQLTKTIFNKILSFWAFFFLLRGKGVLCLFTCCGFVFCSLGNLSMQISQLECVIYFKRQISLMK